jgi:hypothetical protein
MGDVVLIQNPQQRILVRRFKFAEQPPRHLTGAGADESYLLRRLHGGDQLV